MSEQDFPQFNRYINRLPTLSGLAACLAGALVLVGWSFDITLFKSIHPSLVAVKPNTAVAFLLSGLSLLILNGRQFQKRTTNIEKLVSVLAGLTAGIGLLTIAEYLLKRSFGIDQFLFRESSDAVGTYLPGRMSPLAAVCFLFIGIAHFLAYRRRYWGSQFLSLWIILLAVTSIFGYAFRVKGLYSPGPYTSLAIQSAVTFLIIGVGTISLFPSKSIIKTLFQDDVGGFVARRLLPTAFIIPLFFGFITLGGERMGFYGPNVTVLLITIATVITFTIVIFSNARLLSIIEQERRESNRLRKREAETSEQRLSFLAKASRILSRSLELETTLKSIARLSVPFLSDWCAIYLVQENGAVSRVAGRYTDYSNSNVMSVLEEKYPGDPVTSEGVFEVIATGNSLMIPDIPDEQFRKSAHDEEHLRLILALGLHSVIIAPLKGHEKIYGAITFAMAESGRKFSVVDKELAEEMARRAAVAIENARLYHETRHQNEILERRVRERTNELEVANLELRTEIVERKRIETSLRDSEKTLASLVRTASRLITLRHLDQVSEIICQETAGVLNVPVCTSAIFDSLEKRWFYTYGHGVPAAFGERLSLDLESIEKIAGSENTNLFRITGDVQTFTNSPNYELYKAYDLRTTVDIDMVIENRLIGRLKIATTGETREFTENELMLLKGLADQAALAIQNAQLLDQVEHGQRRLRRLTQQLVSAQEGERRRISRELHDEAGQALTAMKMSLSLMGQLVPESQAEWKEQLADLSELAGEIMEQLRMLAQDLRPPALEALGLNKSLEGLCRQFSNRTNISITYNGVETAALSEEITITIYRMVQEALTNAAKHAGADLVQVTLEESNDSLIVCVKDNGRGFHVEKTDSFRHSLDGMGLGGMEERIEFINGHMEIKSEPGKGTEIIATIPLPGGKL